MKKLVKIELKTETVGLLELIGHENESVESVIDRLIEVWKQK